jgi:GntR family transcriptional repressor for pyruvate dehydrogenase complex
MLTMAASSSRKRKAFVPLRHVRKSDDVFEQLSKLIREKRFPLGSQLPPERELAEQINASRQTIREALYRAELVGLIEVRHGAGSFVVSSSARSSLDAPLAELIARQADRIAEFFEIRLLVEGWCVSQAARQAKPADLAALKRRLDAMKSLPLTDPAWEQNDVEFHVAIARSTGNPIAVRMIEILRESFSVLYRLKQVVANLEDAKLVWKHHWNIYEGIRKHSPAAASKALRAHMKYIRRQLDVSVQGNRLSSK